MTIDGPAETAAPPCAQCGRDVRRLNPASDPWRGANIAPLRGTTSSKCVGCGYPPEICTCETTAD